MIEGDQGIGSRPAGAGSPAAGLAPRADPLAPLLAAIAAGDRVAFEELYRLTAAKLFGLCLRILPRRPDAEEALQDCYTTIWRKAAVFDPARGSALAWLVALARNRAIDRLRATGHAYAESDPPAEDVVRARAEHVAQGLRRELADCLALLDQRDSAFVTTAFFHGDTYAELAQTAGLAVGNGQDPHPSRFAQAARVPRMTGDIIRDGSDDEALAAELALGLLDETERADAERRVDDNFALQADLRWWRELLATLVDGPGEPPPPSLWNRVVARLPANDVVTVPPAAVAMRRWRGGAISAGVIAMLLGAGLVTSLGRPPRLVTRVDRIVVAPPLVAVLTSSDDPATTLAISYDPRSARLRAVPARLEADGGALELWVIPADGRPRSLGLLPVDAGTLPGLPLAARPFLRTRATLAVSREPRGGSPTGAPTGPVILKGQVVDL